MERLSKRIDTIEDSPESRVERGAKIVLSLGRQAIRFAGIERAPRYNECRHENDAEHSFMLSLIATELAAELMPHMDVGLVAQFGNVHDMPELITDDEVTFAMSEQALAQKEAREQAAVEKLVKDLPPHTANLVRRYVAQQEPEARLVRMIDKMLPLVANIFGPGRRVMRESFGIERPGQLQETERAFSARIKSLFPEGEFDDFHAIRDILAERFQAHFEGESEAIGEDLRNRPPASDPYDFAGDIA